MIRCFLRPILLSIVTSVFKTAVFNINICCFITAVCIMFTKKTLVDRQTSCEVMTILIMSKISVGRHLAFSETENVTIRSASCPRQLHDRTKHHVSVLCSTVCHFKFLDKIVSGRHPGFGLGFCCSR